MTTNALARPNSNGVAAMNAPIRINTDGIDLMTLCETLVRSGHFKDARDASQALVKVLYGQELGIGPVAAMMGIHVIEGKPAPSANLLGAMVKRSGRYNYRVREHTAEACELEFYENGESIGKLRWTFPDATKAGLTGKAVWKSYPRAMLFSRCMSEGVRTYFPDLFGGALVYTPEELGAEVTADGELISLPATPAEAAVTRAESQPSYGAAANLPPAAPEPPKSVWATSKPVDSSGDAAATAPPVANVRDPEEIERRKAAYFALLAERSREAKASDDLRYCLEAILLGKSEALTEGGKSKWDARHWCELSKRLANCDIEDALAKAFKMLSDSEDIFDGDAGAVPAGGA